MGDLSGASNKVDDSAAVQITGKIMVVAIIILFFVVVIVCFLHLYAKWFWWRIEGSSTTPDLHSRGRRRRGRRFVFAAGQDPAIYGAQRSGLNPEVLRSIPVLVYQPEDFKDGLECAVCLSELVHGEKARLLPKCNHGFHVECIDMWFQSHSTCPLCRNPVASESFKSCGNSGVREDDSENNSQSSESESSDAMSEIDLESPNFPTNVLIWGSQTQMSSNGASLEEGGPSQQVPSSSAAGSSSNNTRRQGMLVIDIPSEIYPSSLSPSASRFAEDDLKSPVTSRLKSLKRILSKRFSPRSPSSVDVEQGGREQN